MMRHQKHHSSNNAYWREHIGGRASSHHARSGRQYFKPNFGKYYGSEFDRGEERRLTSNIRRSAEPSGSSRYDQYHEERGRFEDDGGSQQFGHREFDDFETQRTRSRSDNNAQVVNSMTT